MTLIRNIAAIPDSILYNMNQLRDGVTIRLGLCGSVLVIVCVRVLTSFNYRTLCCCNLYKIFYTFLFKIKAFNNAFYFITK